MIITCPECKTRYKTNAEAIGPNGRTVRCANCRATWFVPAEGPAQGDELTLDKLALADIEREERASALHPVDATAHEGSPRQSISENKAAESTMAESTPKPRQSHNVRETVGRKHSKRRFWNVMLIWLLPLLLMGAAALCAYVMRQDIVKRLPQTASVYKALGIDVSAPGLSLSKPATRYAQIDGRPVLIVEGRVRNISQETQDVPLVALTLRNKTGERVANWNVELETRRLAPGAFADYMSQYPNPPIDVVDLTTRFANEVQGAITPLQLSTPQERAPQESDAKEAAPTSPEIGDE